MSKPHPDSDAPLLEALLGYLNFSAGSSDPDKIWKPFDETEASRRTIYAHVKRALIVPLMEVLDFCDTTRSTARRLNTAVSSQFGRDTGLSITSP